jgi:hypothetical protein
MKFKRWPRVGAVVFGAGAMAAGCWLIFAPVLLPWLTWQPLQAIGGGMLVLIVALAGPAGRAAGAAARAIWRALLAVSRRDAAFLIGVGAVVFGAWQVFAPLAWVIGGAALVAAAWILTPAKPRAEQGAS